MNTKHIKFNYKNLSTAGKVGFHVRAAIEGAATLAAFTAAFAVVHVLKNKLSK